MMTPDMKRANDSYNELEKKYNELCGLVQAKNEQITDQDFLKANIQQIETKAKGQEELLKMQDKTILELNKNIASKSKAYKELEDKYAGLESSSENVSDEKKELNIEILGLKKEKNDLESKIADLEKEVESLRDMKSQYKTTMGLLKDRDDKIAELEKKLETAKKEAVDVEKALE